MAVAWRVYYYQLMNVTRSTSNAEEDAFSESDIKDFLDDNVEARNYCVDPENEMSEEEFRKHFKY